MRKKRLFLLFVLAMVVAASASRISADNIGEIRQPDPKGQYWPLPDQVEGRQWVVYDRTTGEFLLDHNGSETAWPASTTKIMTALIVLESCDPDDVVTVSSDAVKLPAGSSKIGLLSGEEVRVRDLLGGLITASGNDAANALAEAVGGDLPGFSRLMNTRALELGMTGTNFTNPSGLHEDQHYSTARDMAVLTAFALQDDRFRELIALPYYSMPATNLHPFSGWGLLLNTNRFMNFGETTLSSDWIERYLGGKTGTTMQAGNNLVCVATTRNGHELIAVLFGVPSESAGNTYIYTRTLLEAAAATIAAPTPSPAPTSESIPETTPSETTPLTPASPLTPAAPGDTDGPAGSSWRTAFIVLAFIFLISLLTGTLYVRRLRRH